MARRGPEEAFLLPSLWTLAIAASFLLARSFHAFAQPESQFEPLADSMSATLLCPTPTCELTFETNGGWPQRVHIRRVGGGFDVTKAGQGEAVTHYSALVIEGIYEVTAWHKKPGGNWMLSDIVAGFELHGSVARADDGGAALESHVNDMDFNDVVVTLKPL